MVIYPIWIAAVVQYAINARFTVLDVIIDGIRKPAGECAMESETLVVNTRVKGKRRHVALERCKEVVTEIRAVLPFVKQETVAQVVLGGLEDCYTYATSSRN